MSESTNENLHRREFLGHAALTGAAAGLALMGGVHSEIAAQVEPRRAVVGVMGLSRGRSLAVSFAKQPGVEIKYVCDVDGKRAADGAAVVEGAVGKAPQAISDFRKMLDDKDLDALICAAPNHWHAPATILACSAGKHVYVEKPCSHNPHEGELMVQAARKNNRAVQMGSQRRSSLGTIEAMQKLRDGAIGRVYLAQSWYTNLRPSIGIGKPAAVPAGLDFELWQGPAPRVPYVDNVVPYNWHWFWHWGNGELGNNGVHTLDLCRWGIGGDFPIRVTSSGGRYHFNDDQQTPDTHTVCYEFSDERQIVWEGRSCNKHGDDFVTFYGDNGTLELKANGAYVIYDLNDKQIGEMKNSNQGDIEHIVNFLEAIRTEKPLSCNAEIAEGHKSTLLCHLGNIAHRAGRALHCDATNGHIQNDEDAMKLWRREYAPGWEPTI